MVLLDDGIEIEEVEIDHMPFLQGLKFGLIHRSGGV